MRLRLQAPVSQVLSCSGLVLRCLHQSALSHSLWRTCQEAGRHCRTCLGTEVSCKRHASVMEGQSASKRAVSIFAHVAPLGGVVCIWVGWYARSSHDWLGRGELRQCCMMVAKWPMRLNPRDPTSHRGGAHCLPFLWCCCAAGAGFWDTPMSRHLFEGKKQSPDPGNMYFAMLRMPLSGVFW